jgi:hypothetical protein
MAESLTTMEANVRYNLDETSASYWTSAEVQNKIVRRFRRLWSRIIAIRDDWFKSTTPQTLTLASGTLRYALPTGYFRTATIRTTTSGKESVKWQWMSCKDPRFIDGQRADVTYTDPGIIYYDIEGFDYIVVSPLPRSTLVASHDFYTLPTDPSTTFSLPDAVLSYVEAAATADLLAKGPAGSLQYWRDEAQSIWINELLPLLGAPRSGQNSDHALSPFEAP